MEDHLEDGLPELPAGRARLPRAGQRASGIASIAAGDELVRPEAVEGAPGEEADAPPCERRRPRSATSAWPANASRSTASLPTYRATIPPTSTTAPTTARVTLSADLVLEVPYGIVTLPLVEIVIEFQTSNEFLPDEGARAGLIMPSSLFPPGTACS